VLLVRAEGASHGAGHAVPGSQQVKAAAEREGVDDSGRGRLCASQIQFCNPILIHLRRSQPSARNAIAGRASLLLFGVPLFAYKEHN
jgi:hypothetical protein